MHEAIKKYYNPWKTFSTYRFVVDIPGWPRVHRQEFSAHSVDGVVVRPDEKAWRIIERNNLIPAILLPIAEKRVEELESELRATQVEATEKLRIAAEALIAIRDEERKNKNFARSDAIRDVLKEIGFSPRDVKVP